MKSFDKQNMCICKDVNMCMRVLVSEQARIYVFFVRQTTGMPVLQKYKSSRGEKPHVDKR